MAIPTQDWAPTGQFQYLYDAGVLSPIPNVFNGIDAPVPAVSPNIIILIKNVIDEDPNVVSPYSEYRLGASSSSDTDWLAPSSYVGKGFPPYPVSEGVNEYVPYTNGMDFVFTPEFINLSSLANGDYFWSIGFTIWGKDVNNYWDSIGLPQGFVIKLTVANQIVPVPVTFSPDTLAFEHIKNGDDTSLPVTIDGTLWSIIGKTNFTLSSADTNVSINTINNSGLIHQIAQGSGEATVSITLSEYYDSDEDFTIEDLASSFLVRQDGVNSDQIDFTVLIIIIPDFITNPYPDNIPAFTLDNKYFEIYSSTPDTYIQLDAVIKTYNFFTNLENETELPQKIVLFKYRSKINLGRVIHRLMRRFDKVFIDNLQYKLASLVLTCTELLVADDTVVQTQTLTPIRFIAGLSRGITTLGFLEFNQKPNRVTKNGFYYLNMLVPTGDYRLKIYKNGEFYTTLILLPSGGNIMLRRQFFSGFVQGDVIDIYLGLQDFDVNLDTPKKRFVVFPEGNYSNFIVWENEFLVQSVLECTGTASIKSDFEFLSQKIYQDLVEKLEHLASNKEVKLSINTGWLMKTDIDTVESLMRSKRAWLHKHIENTSISLRPIAKTMINDDLERELIEYTLEFTINRTYDEETYKL